MKLSKNNLSDFFEYYHFFYDSYITNINYLINDNKIELYIDVCWSGKPILKENKIYETNKTKLKLIFDEIKEFNCKEIFSWDYIDKAYIDNIKIDGKDYICFASNKENSLIYIISDNIEINEIK